jgi:hypothetical protein
MSKKAILITAIALAATGAIAGIYIAFHMLEAKTQDERNFAEKRWTDTCITNK